MPPVITLHLNDEIIKSLSGPELEILKYAYEHTEDVLGMSIQQVAAGVAYSPTTVLRFCKKLGYSGFAEFKYALRAQTREKDTPVSTRSGRAFTAGMMLDALSANLQATSKLIREEQLLQTFQYLESGCPIYLWSPGGLTSVAAEYFEKLLLSIGRQEVYLVESVKMFEQILKSLTQKPLLILISTSGKYPTTIRLGKLGRVNGIPILAISPYANNDVADSADISFRFFATQRENLGAEFTSRLPIFFVINMIIQCYLRWRGEGESDASTV